MDNYKNKDRKRIKEGWKEDDWHKRRDIMKKWKK